MYVPNSVLYNIVKSTTSYGLGIGGLTGNGQVDLNSGVLMVGSNNQSTTFSGSILDSVGGGSLVKTGSGGLTLTAASSFTGATSVNSGSLWVLGPNGKLPGTVTVNSGGLLGGSGTLGGIIDANGGQVAPNYGSNLSTGNLSLQTGSIVDLQFGGGSNSKVVVSGASGLTIASSAGIELYQAGTTNRFDSPGTYQLIGYTARSTAVDSRAFPCSTPTAPAVTALALRGDTLP